MPAARHRNQLRFINQSTMRLVTLLDRLECHKRLSRDDLAFDNPINRSTIEQFIGALRSHASDMLKKERLALLLPFFKARLLPERQTFQRLRTHGQLDQMKRHAAFFVAKRITIVPSVT